MSSISHAVHPQTKVSGELTSTIVGHDMICIPSSTVSSNASFAVCPNKIVPGDV